MSNHFVPYLSSGIFFDLLLACRKTRNGSRDKILGVSDGLSDSDMLNALISAVTEEKPFTYEKSFNKATSNFKKCENITSEYIPLDKPHIAEAYYKKVQQKSPNIIKLMSELINNYIMAINYEWLVKALIQTILDDQSIPDDVSFAISLNKSISKAKLSDTKSIYLDVFLCSVLAYVLTNHPDNYKGKETFEKWHKQGGERKPWVFKNYSLDKEISHSIKVHLTTDSDFLNKTQDTNCDNARNDIKSKSNSSDNHKTDDNRPIIQQQIINHGKIINQNANEIYNIEHVDHIE